MQLKRDTEYALRLLFCAMQSMKQQDKGLSSMELSRKAGVPITIGNRLCQTLEEAHLINVMESSDGRRKYIFKNNTKKKTIYDVILAVEGSVEIFAVFDPSSPLYAHGKDCFEWIEGRVTETLKSVRLMDLEKNFEIRSK